MLVTILNWLSGGLLDKLLGFFERREAQRIEAMNDEQRRAHEDKLDARRTAKEIRVATAMHWEMRLLTFLIAFPFVVHLWSIWLDTQFAAIDWGIPPFPPPFDQDGRAILLSFFGLVGFTGAAKAVAGAIAYRRR